MKTFLPLLFIIFISLSSNVIFGQQISDEVENWITPYDLPLRLVYKGYNKTDVDNASKKLQIIRATKSTGEWEGSYEYSLGIVNFQGLHISKEHGFVEYNYYTCQPTLYYLNYGKISETEDVIQLIPESQPTSPRNKFVTKELIKVRWHDRNYLVYEQDLINFSKMTAGLYVMKEDLAQPEFGYYSKKKYPEFDESREEMPIYPDRFKKYLLSPINSSIKKIIDRKVLTEKNKWDDELEVSATYKILIGVGKSEGVEVGMSFYVTDKDELIKIVKVSEKTSVGEIVRDANKTGIDICTDDEHVQINCAEIKKGLKVKTKSQFYLNH